MNYENLTFERSDAVATVTFKRPAKSNALSSALMEEVIHICAELRSDVQTRVVIFTGAGRNFSAGVDLGDLQKRNASNASLIMKRRTISIGPRLIRALREIDQITIAAINGGAVGGGACIASALDFRIGADDCFVSYPEILLGMNLSWGALPLCVHLVGPARSKRLVILAEREPAPVLADWGFLDEVVPAGELMNRAREMAAAYAARPPIQAQMIKRSINAMTSPLDSALTHMDADQFLLCATTDDHVEGVQAFLQKRKADFKGN